MQSLDYFVSKIGRRIEYTNAVDRKVLVEVTTKNFKQLHKAQEHGWTLDPARNETFKWIERKYWG